MAFWKRKRRPATGRRPASAGGIDDEWPPREILGYPLVMLNRKELLEEGFGFCGRRFTDLFAQAGITLTLDDESEPPAEFDLPDEQIIRWLWVDEVCLVEDPFIDVIEVEFADGTTWPFYQLDWQLIEQLRLRYRHPDDPERNWQLGEIDEGLLLILCRPDELESIARHPDFPGFASYDLGAVANMTVRRHAR
jgi:hypothetical protein